MEAPRYEVHSITGYTINPAAPGAGSKITTSYAVLDRLDCFREVGSFYSTVGRGGQATVANRRRLAEELCSRLNAAEERSDAA